MNTLTVVQFHKLPAMSFEEMDKAGLVTTILNDLPGVTAEQLAQVHGAGIPLGALHPPAKEDE